MGSLRLDGLSIRGNQFARHHSQTPETLGEDIGLDVSVVVFACPDESTGGFDSLGDHVIDESMFVVDAGSIEFGLVCSRREESV